MPCQQGPGPAWAALALGSPFVNLSWATAPEARKQDWGLCGFACLQAAGHHGGEKGGSEVADLGLFEGKGGEGRLGTGERGGDLPPGAGVPSSSGRGSWCFIAPSSLGSSSSRRKTRRAAWSCEANERRSRKEKGALGKGTSLLLGLWSHKSIARTFGVPWLALRWATSL